MEKIFRFFLVVFLLAFLASCGEKAVKPADSTGRETKTKSSTQKKGGGGYYKDDGPGDNIPANLEQIPDAQPRVEPLHRFANRPYVVLGKSYSPNTSIKAFKQRGIASWYGKKFHGQKTSIGETYDMFGMTAAHPTLALPSYVRVTNVKNGKSVIVRVNDRGPFHADRIIDLSYVAAHRLGYIGQGSTAVEVETITPEEIRMMASAPSKPVPVRNESEPDDIEKLAATFASLPTQAHASKEASSQTLEEALSIPVRHGIFLQLGAFSSIENAENLKAHFLNELDWINENISIELSGLMYRVFLGPYPARANAEEIANQISQAMGYRPGIIQR